MGMPLGWRRVLFTGANNFGKAHMKVARRILKIVGLIIGVFVLLLAGLLGYAMWRYDAPVGRGVRAVQAKSDSMTIARGEFLYKNSLQCWMCHSPGQNPMAPPSGGMKFDLTTMSPALGVYYAKNITPDRETGIGSWTDGEIVRAIREGLRKDNTVLFPIMPVDPLSGLSDNDVLAIVSYMRTLPAVRNKVPQREVSLFAKTLMTVGMIGPMPAHPTPVTAPPRANTVEYGKYVARHAALCADCHTPRNLMNGEFYYDSLLAGSSFKFGEPIDPIASYAPNITPDSATGIGQWTESQFLTLMRSGLGADGKVRSRHMPYSFTGLWDSLELRAVYTFIQSIPPVKRTVPPSEYVNDALSKDPLVHGRGIFNSYCQPCHGTEGKGAPPTNVVLAEVAPSLGDGELKEFVMAGNPDLRMPSFGKTLSQRELDAVVTYVRSWSSPASSR
jgi:mono/diheme cytochrome c family protein